MESHYVPYLRVRLLLASVVVFVVLLSGCSAASLVVPKENIIMVDRTGAPVDPTGNTDCTNGDKFPCNGKHSDLHLYRPIGKSDYDGYIQAILDRLDQYKVDKDGKKKILIFIHGGLNTQVSTVERASDYYPLIKDHYFPIFINWQSSLVSSYFNQLFYQRQGRDWKSGFLGLPLSPFYLAKDLARAAARLVPVEVFMFKNDLQTRKVSKLIDDQKEALIKPVPSQPAMDIALGRDGRSFSEQVRYFSAYVLTIPTKLVISPVLDAFGTSSWDSMLRASETPFHSDELERTAFKKVDASDKIASEQRRPPDTNPAVGVRDTNGGLSVFLDRLHDYIEKNGGAEKFEIVLVGHSMGTIVINEILRKQPPPLPQQPVQKKKKWLPITNVVYMAAACTIKDYEDSVFPYLRSYPDVNIYHLVLHRRAEQRERTTAFGLGVLDLPPRGSLLVWIDNFLSDPKTYRDRTAGRTQNFITALGDLDAWQDIMPQIHLREFSAGDMFEKTDPQHHGDFGKITYWNPECWKPHPNLTPQQCYDPTRP